MLPKFEFGEEVRIVRNVRNDGTYPGVPTGQSVSYTHLTLPTTERV